MKKYFSKRKNMQLAALVVSGLLSASAADAADLVVTVPSDYTNSELGTVSGSRVTTHIDAETHKAVMQGLGGDFAPFNYHQQGKSMLFARRYTYSTTNLLPSFLLDPNKLGASAKTAEGIVSAVPNAHAAVANDGFIYMTGYDLGQIGRSSERRRALGAYAGESEPHGRHQDTCRLPVHGNVSGPRQGDESYGRSDEG